jgi:hypothetical protein
MSAESSKAEPGWLKALVATMLVCVGGGIAGLLAGARPGTILFLATWSAIMLAAAIATICAVILHRRGQGAFSKPTSALFENLTPLPLPAEGPAWVSVSPGYAQRTRRMLWIWYVWPVLILMPLLFVPDPAAESAHAGTRSMHRVLELLTWCAFVVTAAGAILVRRGINRHLRARLGADKEHLLYDPGTGAVERYEWSEVLTDKAALLIGRQIVPLVRVSFGDIVPFPREPLRGFILARLPRASFVAPVRFQWNALKRGNASLCVTAVSLVLFGALCAVSELKPEWHHAVRDALMAWIIHGMS